MLADMPEGDSVWRAARRLHEAFAGTHLRAAQLRWPSLAGSDLTGWRTVEVVPRGKHLLHRFDSGFTLHSHLRMEGRWDVSRGGGRPPPARSDVRAWLATDDVTALGRRLGRLDLVRTAAEASLVGHLGPDLLGSDWDTDQVVAVLQHDPREVADALLDQRVLAGLGTLWTSEVLYARRLAPTRPAAEVPGDELRELITLAHRWLHRATGLAVPERRSRPDRVYGRSGRPCPRCGAPIRTVRVGTPPSDRTVFLCPTCQVTAGSAEDSPGRGHR